MCCEPIWHFISPSLLFCAFFLALFSSSKLPVSARLLLLAPFCNALMQTLESNPVTKIVWNSVKPLLMGKILYTPDSPAVRKILKSVRGTTSSPTPHLLLCLCLCYFFLTFSISFAPLSICLYASKSPPFLGMSWLPKLRRVEGGGIGGQSIAVWGKGRGGKN